MIVYHGTTYENFISMKEDGCIKRATSKLSPYSSMGGLSTTYGYVYVTTNLSKAIDFANRCAMATGKRTKEPRILVVIKIEIDSNVLELDEDENQFGDSNANDCYRYANDIALKNAMMNKWHFGSYQKYCDYYDSLTDEMVNHINWIEI